MRKTYSMEHNFSALVSGTYVCITRCSDNKCMVVGDVLVTLRVDEDWFLLTQDKRKSILDALRIPYTKNTGQNES